MKKIKHEIKRLIFILKNYSVYRNYKKRINKKQVVDFTRNCGYFFTVGLIFYDPCKESHKIEMQSGKTAICQLLDYETFRDPWDMIKWSKWQILGYEGIKLISECTFEEYIELYFIKK